MLHVRRARRTRQPGGERAARDRPRDGAARDALPSRHDRLALGVPRRDQGRHRADRRQYPPDDRGLRIHAPRQPGAGPGRLGVPATPPSRRSSARCRSSSTSSSRGRTRTGTCRFAISWRTPARRSTPRRRCGTTPASGCIRPGSTGAPKGTVHIHSSPIQTAELYAQPILGIRESDLVFSAAKLFFAYGLGNALTFPLSVGATTLLMAERPTPPAVFRRLKEQAADDLLRRSDAVRGPPGQPRSSREGGRRRARLRFGRRGAPRQHRRALDPPFRRRDPRRDRLHGDAPHLPFQPARGSAVRDDRQARAGVPDPPGRGRRAGGRRRTKSGSCTSTARPRPPATGTTARRPGRPSSGKWTRTRGQLQSSTRTDTSPTRGAPTTC